MKKLISIILSVFCLLTLVACNRVGNSEDTTPVTSTDHNTDAMSVASTDKTADTTSVVDTDENVDATSVAGIDENAASIPAPNESSSDAAHIGTFWEIDSAAFSGGVERIFYAGDNKLLVYADAMHLYDTITGTTIAEYTFEGGRLKDITCTPTVNGYAITGWQSGDGNGASLGTASGSGVMCYIFNSSLTLKNTFSLDSLLTANGGVMAAKASPDGDHIAFSDLDSLYLYSISNDSVSTVISNDQGIGIIGAMTFTQQGSRIVFLGDDMYGSVALDGSNLIYGDSHGYALGDSMICYDDTVWIPQDFTKASGRLLRLDGTCQKPSVVNFTQGDTGKDGVFGSEQGRYLATASLMENGIRMRIYDSGTLELVAEREFTHTDGNYFAREPRGICLFDDARAGVVLCGYDQHTISFNFTF